MSPCPCGSGLPYEACCGRFHHHEDQPPTAEALMRSRYSAYVKRDEAYLLLTWHPSTRPAHIGFDSRLRWRKLEILDTSGGSLFESEGTVLFEAHYVEQREPGVLRENSRFVREGGAWRYVAAIPE